MNGPDGDPDLLELAGRDRGAFLAELDRRIAAWQQRISSGTPEGDAELAEFIRQALADQELHDGGIPDGWMLLCATCHRADGTHADGCGDLAIPRRAGAGTGRCPDGGACHHDCTRGCFRVACAAPLSASGWACWPDEIREAYGDADGTL